MPYQIQGQSATIGAEPRTEGGHLYVPLGDIVEQLGGRVSWDNQAKIATATIGQWTATIPMAGRNVDVSGTPVTLAADTFVDQGVMFVPVNFFRDAFGYQVQAEPGSKQVSISLPG